VSTKVTVELVFMEDLDQVLAAVVVADWKQGVVREDAITPDNVSGLDILGYWYMGELNRS
jgi:hypothetical protein